MIIYDTPYTYRWRQSVPTIVTIRCNQGIIYTPIRGGGYSAPSRFFQDTTTIRPIIGMSKHVRLPERDIWCFILMLCEIWSFDSQENH